MGPADWLVVGQWLAAAAVMAVFAWEPWRQTRRTAAASPPVEAARRIASPGYVFVLPLLVLAAPLVPGSGALWRQPHLLLPGVAVALVAVVAVQAVLCHRVLIGSRRRYEALMQAREAPTEDPSGPP
jgi:hypothetical protein